MCILKVLDDCFETIEKQFTKLLSDSLYGDYLISTSFQFLFQATKVEVKSKAKSYERRKEWKT